MLKRRLTQYDIFYNIFPLKRVRLSVSVRPKEGRRPEVRRRAVPALARKPTRPDETRLRPAVGGVRTVGAVGETTPLTVEPPNAFTADRADSLLAPTTRPGTRRRPKATPVTVAVDGPPRQGRPPVSVNASKVAGQPSTGLSSDAIVVGGVPVRRPPPTVPVTARDTIGPDDAARPVVTYAVAATPDTEAGLVRPEVVAIAVRPPFALGLYSLGVRYVAETPDYAFRHVLMLY